MDAPVTMFRVYWMCPGVSAMMNLRRGRGEVAVGDVDRDALLALGPQAVGEQGQVGVVLAALLAGPLHRGQLVLEDRLGVVQQPPDQGALAVVHRAGRGQPQDVHVPVASARGSPAVPRAALPSSEVPLPLAVFHGGLAGPVVGAGLAALGDPGGRDLRDDLARSWPRSTPPRRCRSCRRRCGSARWSRTAARRRPRVMNWLSASRIPSRSNTLARVREVDRRDLQLLPVDVVPDVQLGPVGQREHPDVLAAAGSGCCRCSTARGAGSWGPTGRTRRGTRTPAPWPGPSPRPGGRRRTPRRTGCSAIASSSVVVCSRLRLAQRPVSSTTRPASIESCTDATTSRTPSSATRRSRKSITSAKLCPVSTCMTGNGIFAGAERPLGQREHDDRVLAAGEQQHRPLELGRHLAHDVDGLGLEHVELGQQVVGTRQGHQADSGLVRA